SCSARRLSASDSLVPICLEDSIKQRANESTQDHPLSPSHRDFTSASDSTPYDAARRGSRGSLRPLSTQEGRSMHASRVIHVSILALALAIAGHVSAAKAAEILSDRMLVTDSAGVPIFDNSIPETAAAGEPTLTYAGGPLPVTPPPIPL